MEHRIGQEVVLGSGGWTGAAWSSGLAIGLRHEGLDLARADLIVATSAGAMVGALLATGGDLSKIKGSKRQLPPSARQSEQIQQVLSVLGDPPPILQRGGVVQVSWPEPRRRIQSGSSSPTRSH